MDRVPQCRLLTPFQESTHQKLLSQEQGDKLYYSRYSQVSLLPACASEQDNVIRLVSELYICVCTKNNCILAN